MELITQGRIKNLEKLKAWFFYLEPCYKLSYNANYWKLWKN